MSIDVFFRRYCSNSGNVKNDSNSLEQTYAKMVYCQKRLSTEEKLMRTLLLKLTPSQLKYKKKG